MTRRLAARRATRRSLERADAETLAEPAPRRAQFLVRSPCQSIRLSALVPALAILACALIPVIAAHAQPRPEPEPEIQPAVGAASDVDARASAAFDGAEKLRVAGQCPEALEAYETLAVDQARTVWAARAALGVARCLVALGRGREAMPYLQRARGSADALTAAEAQQALRWNTVLARVHLRDANEPIFASGAAAMSGATRLRDVMAMAALPGAVGSADGAAETRIALLTESAYLLYDGEGRLTQSFVVQHPRGLLIEASGAARVVTRNGAMTGRAGEPPIVWRAARGGSAVSSTSGGAAPQPLEDLSAACGLATGDVIVAERRTRGVQRFAADGTALGPFSTGAVHRCAASERGDVALLDRESRSVTLFDARGKVVHRLPARGERHQFTEPVDVAFDPVGHLFVLDRAAATVWMFDPQGALFERLVSPASGDGAFPQPGAMTVDAIGRLWIYDEQLRRVVLWQ